MELNYLVLLHAYTQHVRIDTIFKEVLTRSNGVLYMSTMNGINVVLMECLLISKLVITMLAVHLADCIAIFQNC